MVSGIISQKGDDWMRSVEEDALLSSISMIDSTENAERYRDEFHNSKNIYTHADYLVILERIKSLLLKGINDTEQVIKIIKNGADELV